MNRFNIVEAAIGLVGLFFSLFSNDRFADLMFNSIGIQIGKRKSYEEMSKIERWGKSLLSLAGIVVFFYLTILPLFAPDNLGELRGYEEAERCISNSCSPQMCVDDFDKNFSSFPDSKKLHEELKISHTPEACNPPEPPSPPAPENSHHPVLPDAKITASDTRLAALKATAAKWRSRTAPIYENLADLLGSITTYDQSRFDNQPSSEEAWDYLQSIQKIISSETAKIRSQDKSAISINVDVTGIGDVGDRAAKRLDDWLGSHRFNTSKNGSMIYVTVKGSQESHHNNYTSQKDANTSLCISAKWLDGSLFFESKVGPVLASAGSNTDAENHSFDGAVSKMISVFRSHVD